MKTYFIKIDRKSVKSNPNAGQTTLHELVSTDCTVTIIGDHESLEDDTVKLVEQQTKINIIRFCQISKYIVLKPHEELYKYLELLRKKFKDRLSYEVRNNYNEINLLQPEPPYLYEYRNTKVTCRKCKKKFDYTKLVYESNYNDDYENYDISEGCPCCGIDQCCKIEFESFESVVLKKLGLPKVQVG